MSQLTFQDSQGDWWVPTGEGLFRFPRVADFKHLARVQPKAVYTAENGLPRGEVFRLFENGYSAVSRQNALRKLLTIEG